MCGELVSLTIQLAMPPSTNRIWRSAVKGGRVRTYRAREYAAWMIAAAWRVKQAVQSQGAVKGDVRVRLGFWPRDKRADLDNRIKPLLDSLVKGGAIENDNRVVHIEAEWRKFDGDPTAHIQVMKA